jgi:hypothetical protein
MTTCTTRLIAPLLISLGMFGCLPSDAAEQASTAQLLPREANDAQLSEFKRAIRRQYDLKEKSWVKGDYEGLVKGFYSPSAFTAGEAAPQEFTVGTRAFIENYKTFLQDITSVRIESIHTHVNGNMGWDWTNFYADVKPEKAREYPPSPVRILFLWEKVGGKWLCTGDVVLLGRFESQAVGK